MAANLAHAVAHLASQVRPTGRRIGTVQAIDTTTGTLTVTMGGTPVEGIPWQASSYSPVVGDQVTILWDQSAGMLVTGTISTVRVQEPDQEQLVLSREWAWRKFNTIINYDGTPAEPDNWREMDNSSVMEQGRFEFAFQPLLPSENPGVEERCSILTWGDVASMVPTGARIETLALRMKATIPGGWGEPDGGTPRSPRLFGHTYTGDNPPGGAGVAPEAAPGFGPWEPVVLAQGEVVTIPLRADWAQALLDGTITGLMTRADQESYRLRLETTSDPQPWPWTESPELIVTYTPPPEA